ncbi:methyltransferase domain-containing protein [Actinocorallia sp. API 0066]|uniref:methyltransferase domain-containing protein n=1 Tax=Actinocorallia sp. API 0066 TaxID=2896846 RepID=UPI001E4A1725|nr:methyltransferase domain-containing protein [Actinocorallia sp. API 0066]MCD0447793.1 methyltransferase domain-containing protein [Actinocorallia sp. API 0066]
MSRDAWDPERYGAFSAERGRPFAELAARVRVKDPRRVVDLGCGDGRLTATLAERWPAARVQGVDSSPAMVEAARRVPGIDVVLADLAAWRPAAPVDVIVSNAALHWVPGHLDLFEHWVGALNPGGVFAFQVPGNFGAPSHTLLRATAEAHGVALDWPSVAEPAAYLAALTALGCAADVWETTYLQVLKGDDAVLAWMRGTALRPVLAALEDPTDFLADYRTRLRGSYPPTEHGTVFPFRRIFAVARRS